MSVQNGYGFVHYPLTQEGINAALNAVQSLHQVTINQITYDCSISNQLNQILTNIEKQRIRRGGSFGSDDQIINSMFPEVANQNMSSSLGRTTPVADSLAALMNPGVNAPQPAPRQHKMNTSAPEYYPTVPLATLPTNATPYVAYNNAANANNRAPKYFQSFAGSGSGQNSANTSASTTPNSKYNEVTLAPSLPTALPYGVPAYPHDTMATDVDEYNFNRANFRNQFSPGSLAGSSPGHGVANPFFGQSNSSKLRSGSSDSISYGNHGMASYGYGNHIPLNSSSSDSFTSDREFGVSGSTAGLSIATSGLPVAPTPPLSTTSIGGDSPSFNHKTNFSVLAKSNSSTGINELLSSGNTPNTHSASTSIDTTDGLSTTADSGIASLPNYLAGLNLHATTAINHQLRNEDRWNQPGSGKFHPNTNHQLPSNSLLNIWNQPVSSVNSTTNGIAMPPEPPMLSLPTELPTTHQLTGDIVPSVTEQPVPGNVYNSFLYKPTAAQGNASIDDLIGDSSTAKRDVAATPATFLPSPYTPAE
jgi:hypothetical protein